MRKYACSSSDAPVGKYRVMFSKRGIPVASISSAHRGRAIGRDDLGALAPGMLADAVLLTRDLEVRRVWTGGRASAGPGEGAA